MESIRSISFGLAAALVFAGCRSAPAPKPLGATAPQFGASSEYSSLSKFVVGDWVEHLEPKDPSNSSLADRLAGLFQTTLSVRSDSTFTYVFTTHKVTGTWSLFEDQLKLQPIQVDGLSLQQVALDNTKYNTEHQYWSVVAREQSAGDTSPIERQEALDMLRMTGYLVVADDKQRLTQANGGGHATGYWLRLGR